MKSSGSNSASDFLLVIERRRFSDWENFFSLLKISGRTEQLKLGNSHSNDKRCESSTFALDN